MPTISAFFGILIRMYYKEHGISHFHAEYQGQQATFTFDGAALAGDLGSRSPLDWYENRRQRILRNWNQTGKEPDREKR
jgi:hypothetical protein